MGHPYLNSQNDVSFHYKLTNFKTGSTSVKAPGGKFPLGRFVMMSTRDEETNFNIHVPHKGNYLLEIGAARYPTALVRLSLKLCCAGITVFIFRNALQRNLSTISTCASLKLCARLWRK